MALDLSALATEILTDLASTDYVKLIRKTRTFDPVAGDFTNEASDEIGLVAAVLKIPENLIDGTRVQTGDRMVLMDNQTEPLMSDEIKIGSELYKITMIDGFNHAGTQQFWKVVCRR